MQSAAPELIDLSARKQATHDDVRHRPDRSAVKAASAAAARTVQRVSPPTACWPGGSSNAASASSTSIMPRGTITAISTSSWPHNCAMADQPWPRLHQGPQAAGLLDSTLVIWASEFGRTPLGENRGAPTRLPAATIIRSPSPLDGRRRRQGRPGYRQDRRHRLEHRRDPVHVNDFQATILHLFGINHLKLTYPFKGVTPASPESAAR